MRKISADLIITNTGKPIANGAIVFDNDGYIQAIGTRHSIADCEIVRGVLCPGFINAHCHLELSHLRGLVPTGTGLIPFIKAVVTQRDFKKEVIQKAIKAADQEMFDNGIVAVGDISNQVDSFETKSQSRIRYYSFIEMFDFMQDDQAMKSWNQYYKVYLECPDQNGHKKSCVPHAPYSVSKRLFALINEHVDEHQTLSIHNQELKYENDLFLSKSGGFLDFYHDFDIPLTQFQPTGKTSIHYTLDHLKPKGRILFVHNTCTSQDDIKTAQEWGDKVFWATCPNANLYIENRLPRYDNFIQSDAKLCVGTDSLTSNWQLSILEELKTMKRYQSFLPDVELIRWATQNGAEALGYTDLGTLEVGKSPGIVLIDVNVEQGVFDLSKACKSRRLDKI